MPNRPTKTPPSFPENLTNGHAERMLAYAVAEYGAYSVLANKWRAVLERKQAGETAVPASPEQANGKSVDFGAGGPRQQDNETP